MSDNIKAPPAPSLTLTLTAEAASVVVAALAKAPIEGAQAVLAEINAQMSQQLPIYAEYIAAPPEQKWKIMNASLRQQIAQARGRLRSAAAVREFQESLN